MTAPVTQIQRGTGRGRQPATVERMRELEEELAAHHAEALALVDGCWPLLSRIELIATEIGPLARQTVLMLEVLLARYERRHLPSDPGGMAAAA